MYALLYMRMGRFIGIKERRRSMICAGKTRFYPLIGLIVYLRGG